MADGGTMKHKFTVTPTAGGTRDVVDLYCSCGWKSHQYNRYPNIVVVKQTHIIEVLADRAGISVEW